MRVQCGVVLLLGIMAFCGQARAACDVVDDLGRAWHFDQPATRIVSLAPDLTELLFAAGAGAALVGVIEGSDYPAAVKKIPIVATYHSMDSEALLALHPDLIVAWAGGNTERQLQVVQRLKVPVYFSLQREVTAIPVTLERLGCLAGTPQIAHVAAQAFDRHYQALSRRYAHQKPVSVFYEVWPRPLMTVSKESWINQIIMLCGGRNIFAEAKGVAPQINPEAVILANPDVIIHTTSDKTWYNWPRLAAVRKRQIFSVNPDWIERAGPRLLLGAEVICRQIDSARE